MVDPATLSHLDARLLNVADVAHENFVQMTKSQDIRHQLTAVGIDFLGATQVQAKEIPAGPNTVPAK